MRRLVLDIKHNGYLLLHHPMDSSENGVGCFGFDQKDREQIRARVLVLSKRIRHRGPDWTGVHEQAHAILGHERLAIVDPDSGHQPFVDEKGDLSLCVNGEIYNHMDYRTGEFKDYPFKTKSDCEVIMPLYEKYGPNCASKLNGMFAFLLSNEATGEYYVARDHMGIIPLYIGWGRDGSVWFASEMKALVDECEKFEIFPPGHYYQSKFPGKFVRYWDPIYRNVDYIPTNPVDYVVLRTKFEKAVKDRMMSDVPWGVLLSGGLDSSLVASIASRYAAGVPGYPAVHSFSIGLQGSPDLANAKVVAKYLGTIHHEYVFTVQQGMDAYSEVIYHLETYDVTTVRAATPMFLMSRKIRAMGVKMVLSGEGADEVFGGYLYFHKCPNGTEMQKETVRKIQDLHYYDNLRANKSTSAWGVEARVPFLDEDFMNYSMTLDPTEKLSGTHPKGKRMEKYILRKAFDTPEKPYLPKEVLWRQKEQFSDGVGYNWIDSIREYAEREITDSMMASAEFRFPYNTPKTKEAYKIRQIFEKHFPGQASRSTVPGGPSVACSTAAAIEWDEQFKKMAASTGGECSGRSVAGVHEKAYKEGEGAREFKRQKLA